MSIAQSCADLLSANSAYVMKEHIREARETNKHRGYELAKVSVARDGGYGELTFEEDGSTLIINSYREEVRVKETK